MADYEFTSDIETSKEHRINRMHVMALGCKFDGLQALVENNLQNISKKEIPREFGDREVELCGVMRDVRYEVTLSYGACPTFEGGEGHFVDVKTLLDAEDRLSLLIGIEMIKYEAEMTIHIKEVDEAAKSRQSRPSAETDIYY